MEDNKVIANIFKALCDENRVGIVKLLLRGNRCACNIAEELGLSQSRLSYHMKILCESQLVTCWYVGKWTHYKINQDGYKKAINILKDLSNVEDTITNDCCDK